MNELRRELAPLSDRAWSTIEADARRTLRARLAARRLADFHGPAGFECSSVAVGRTRRLDSGATPGVAAYLRQVQALVELHAPFAIGPEEIAAMDRGADDPNLDSVTRAAAALGYAEDRAVFHGLAAAGISGIAEATAHKIRALPDDPGALPAAVANATEALLDAGVEGPFALTLAPARHAQLLAATDAAGHRTLAHIERIVRGPIVRAGALEGGLVTSLRGGDFALHVGRDGSLAYAGHDDEAVRFALLQTFTFRLLSPQAAVALRAER
jgi:uncharacterized linocin/CFP29 family protein